MLFTSKLLFTVNVWLKMTDAYVLQVVIDYLSGSHRYKITDPLHKSCIRKRTFRRYKRLACVLVNSSSTAKYFVMPSEGKSAVSLQIFAVRRPVHYCVMLMKQWSRSTGRKSGSILSKGYPLWLVSSNLFCHPVIKQFCAFSLALFWRKDHHIWLSSKEQCQLCYTYTNSGGKQVFFQHLTVCIMGLP